MNNDIFSIINSNGFRTCTCDACGKLITDSNERTKVCQPWQIRGVNYHTECLNKFVAKNRKAENTTIGSSNNCSNHTVEISHLDAIRYQYYLHYGFRPLGFGKVVAEFKNAESIGSTIYVAFDFGATVKVNSRVVKSVAEYDRVTKEICMR